ncbi:ABC transporter ATP-binding protein [Streptomyces sp. NPDC051018]|uniref:ABC transporter ATP-binding protein n=1 Tax=Streptomyces sp. NPDC051018 TaxID=3365639 RepID=UPI003790FC65
MSLPSSGRIGSTNMIANGTDNAAVEAPSDVYMSFEDVGLTYDRAGRTAPVLAGIDVTLRRGETLCLVGASGCGKSTLLNIAAGFLTATSGSVTAEGRAVTGPSPDRVMVFQEDATFPWFTVRQNVAYGLRARGAPKDVMEQRVAEMIDLVGLSQYADAYPHQLSGGMRKRCDMARALAVDPDSILMDEPFAALDVMTKERLQVQFREIGVRRNLTSMFVTHDLEEALFVGNRVAILRKGPGPLLALVDVPFDKGRDVSIKTRPEFQELRRELGRRISEGNVE